MVDPNFPLHAEQARHYIESSQESLRALHAAARPDQIDTFDNGLAALQAFYAGTLIAGNMEERLYDRDTSPESSEQVIDTYGYLLRHRYDRLWSEVVRGGGIMAHTATGNVAIGSDRRFARDGILASAIAIPAGYTFIDNWPQLAPLARIAFIDGASYAFNEPIALPGLTVAPRNDYEVELSGRHLPTTGVSLPERFATMVREIRDPQLFMNTWRSFASLFRSHAEEFVAALNGGVSDGSENVARAQQRLNTIFMAAQAFPLNRHLRNSWEWSIAYSNVARFNNLMTAVAAMDAYGEEVVSKLFGLGIQGLFDPMLHIEKVHQAEEHIKHLVRVATPGHDTGVPTPTVPRTFIEMIDEIVYHSGLAATGSPVDLNAFSWSDGTISMQDRTLGRNALALFEPGEAGRRRLEAIAARTDAEASVSFNPGRHGDSRAAVGEIVIHPREKRPVSGSGNGGTQRPSPIDGFANNGNNLKGSGPSNHRQLFLSGAQALLKISPAPAFFLPNAIKILR